MRNMFAGLIWLWVLIYPQQLVAAAEKPITVTDNFGRTITLTAPAKRIISLGPHITENLFSAGAGDKIVGVGNHSDYPPAAKTIPSIGDSLAAINLESVLSLSPDLVVAWQTAGNRNDLQKIVRWGIPVYFSEPRNFTDIITNIEKYAYLIGNKNSLPMVKKLHREIFQVEKQYANLNSQKVFYQIWHNPLITLNGEHYISRALELCGAKNVFADLPIIAPRVSVESVIAADPDIMIIGAEDWQKNITMWQKWPAINAVQRNAFLQVDGKVMHRHTLRMIMGIGNLCKQINQHRLN